MLSGVAIAATMEGVRPLLIETQALVSTAVYGCLLYTSDAADERSSVDLGGRRIIKKKNNNKMPEIHLMRKQTHDQDRKESTEQRIRHKENIQYMDA